ncbi:MAG: methyltransferase [Pseudomonadota bacterium]
MTSIQGSDAYTKDAFLGGRVKAMQPKNGYRAGVDAVLLAAACPAQAGETVLELGCGVGVVALCLAARVPGVQITGIEVQPDYATLAAKNGVNVVVADLVDLPRELRQQQFDHVVFNPPYFDPAGTQPADDTGRQHARMEQTPLSLWFDTAVKRLRPKGRLTVIHKANRIPDLLRALPASMGAAELLPLQPRRGRAPHLALLRARKDARTAFKLHEPKYIHAAAHHEGDHPDYTPEFQSILKGGTPLLFPG